MTDALAGLIEQPRDSRRRPRSTGSPSVSFQGDPQVTSSRRWGLSGTCASRNGSRSHCGEGSCSGPDDFLGHVMKLHSEFCNAFRLPRVLRGSGGCPRTAQFYTRKNFLVCSGFRPPAPSNSACVLYSKKRHGWRHGAEVRCCCDGHAQWWTVLDRDARVVQTWPTSCACRLDLEREPCRRVVRRSAAPRGDAHAADRAHAQGRAGQACSARPTCPCRARGQGVQRRDRRARGQARPRGRRARTWPAAGGRGLLIRTPSIIDPTVRTGGSASRAAYGVRARGGRGGGDLVPEKAGSPRRGRDVQGGAGTSWAPSTRTQPRDRRGPAGRYRQRRDHAGDVTRPGRRDQCGRVFVVAVNRGRRRCPPRSRSRFHRDRHCSRRTSGLVYTRKLRLMQSACRFRAVYWSGTRSPRPPACPAETSGQVGREPRERSTCGRRAHPPFFFRGANKKRGGLGGGSPVMRRRRPCSMPLPRLTRTSRRIEERPARAPRGSSATHRHHTTVAPSRRLEVAGGVERVRRGEPPEVARVGCDARSIFGHEAGSSGPKHRRACSLHDDSRRRVVPHEKPAADHGPRTFGPHDRLA